MSCILRGGGGPPPPSLFRGDRQGPHLVVSTRVELGTPGMGVYNTEATPQFHGGTTWTIINLSFPHHISRPDITKGGAAEEGLDGPRPQESSGASPMVIQVWVAVSTNQQKSSYITLPTSIMFTQKLRL